MSNRFIIEAVDRRLRDIMGMKNKRLYDIPFGGMIVVFGGDFIQVTPVVKRGGRSSCRCQPQAFSTLDPRHFLAA